MDVVKPAGVCELPLDSRDVPIPVHVGRVPGTAVRISKIDFDRRLLITADRRCTICGWSIQTGELFWYAASEETVRELQATNWEPWDWSIEGAGHEECLVYSAVVCPYLRDREYERHSAMLDSDAATVVVGKGQQTGEMVLVGAPEMLTRFSRGPNGLEPTVALGGGRPRLHRFERGSDLVPVLEELVAVDRIPTLADRRFVELMISERVDKIKRLTRKTILVLMVEAGIPAVARRRTPCPCGSGMLFEYCCEDSWNDASRRAAQFGPRAYAD